MRRTPTPTTGAIMSDNDRNEFRLLSQGGKFFGRELERIRDEWKAAEKRLQTDNAYPDPYDGGDHE